MAKPWKFESMLKDEQRTNRGIYMPLAMGGISHEQCSALTCVAPDLFSGHGQSPLAESSVTFGACVHSRTPKSAQQLASWKPEGSRIRARSAQHNHTLLPSSFLPPNVRHPAMRWHQHPCNWTSELNWDPRWWLIHLSAILRYSYQQGTSSAWSIALGRGVTVSCLNDLLGHHMTVSTLGVVDSFIFRKEQRNSCSVMYGSFCTPRGPEWSRSICQNVRFG